MTAPAAFTHPPEPTRPSPDADPSEWETYRGLIAEWHDYFEDPEIEAAISTPATPPAVTQ